MSAPFDVTIENGLFFDGTGSPPAPRHLGVRGDRVVAISEAPLPRGPGTRVLDAAGCWVTPGFIDLHTHYDAEVELAPSLSESLRHGVTTVVFGSCSLSLAIGTPEDLADQFCRVEAIPYDVVRRMLEQRKTWSTVTEYFEHLDTLPLGPNVSSFLGHSAMRAHVMGIERSLDRTARPTEGELARMEGILREALDVGYLGMSVMTLKWDKIGGSRPIRSRPLPSTYARWSEVHRLCRQLRERGRVFQGVPDAATKVNILRFLLESAGLVRAPLKTTIISLIDLRADRLVYRLVGLAARIANTWLGADFRLQALPEVFDLWADGIDLVVFEEFGAGAAALHLDDPAARARLLRDPAYRARFRAEWRSRLLPKLFHRDFNQSEILRCPDERLVGKSFVRVAEEEGRDVVDVFLDLVAQHGPALRWYTVMGNDRPGPLEEIVRHPDALIGFSDAGAHLRQMAHYNFPLRMLRMVKDAAREGRAIMPVERAIQRLTAEIGDWLGIDAGRLEVGGRADVVVLDPEGIDGEVDRVAEAPVEGFDGVVRLVRRNDRAVRAVLVNGRLAVQDGQVLPEVGTRRGHGRLLRART
ncbi:N-acyl-D-amino-acid deacylase family protein [Sorangium sp. So ce385]|uniref:N-acyl-D-amino-acid deacylase family protein n=1 Tax=Sorangium sp. So ce385 TaxID=3133308 RepID=UPI003F5C13DB